MARAVVGQDPWTAAGRELDAVIVFTDLVGYTSFTSANGDRAAAALLAELYRSSAEIVEAHGGRIVKRMGDGLMIAFADAAGAVRAALELLDTSPDPLATRAGAHAGPVIDTPEDLVGNTVNIASRICDQAGPHQLLVSDELLDTDPALHELVCSPASHVALRGVSEPKVVCELSRSNEPLLVAA